MPSYDRTSFNDCDLVFGADAVDSDETLVDHAVDCAFPQTPRAMRNKPDNEAIAGASIHREFRESFCGQSKNLSVPSELKVFA